MYKDYGVWLSQARTCIFVAKYKYVFFRDIVTYIGMMDSGFFLQFLYNFYLKACLKVL